MLLKCDLKSVDSCYLDQYNYDCSCTIAKCIDTESKDPNCLNCL